MLFGHDQKVVICHWALRKCDVEIRSCPNDKVLFNVWVVVAKPTVLIFQNRRCFFSFIIDYQALALEVGSSRILHSHCSLIHFFKLYENVRLSATFGVSWLVDVNNITVLPLKKSMEILNICPLSIKS